MSFLTTVLTVGAGTGVIVDSWTDQENFTYEKIEWVEQSIDYGSVTTREFSYPYIDAAGVLQSQNIQPLPDEQRKAIYLGRVVHDISTGDIFAVRPEHMLPGQTSQMFADLLYAIKVPFLFEGGRVTPNADLTFAMDTTRWYGPAESWQQDKDDPNIANNPGADPQAILYLDANGILLSQGFNVDPANYESPLGTIIPVPGAIIRATIQRLYTGIGGNYIMQYGQQWYDNLDEAITHIGQDTSTFVQNPYLRDPTLIAYFVMEKGATDLTNGDDVAIISPEGVVIGGGSSPVLTTDRMRWRNVWIPGEYAKNDTARDGNYLAVANKQTTDRPAPQPIGPGTFLMPDAPVWSTLQYTGSVFSGMHIAVPAGQLFELQQVRVWIANISPDAHYQVVLYDAVNDVFSLSNTVDGDVLDAPGWLSIPVDPVFVTEADDFFVLVHNSNSAGTTDYNHPWVRAGNTNSDADPGAGNWSQNNISTRIRISDTDDDAVDRSAELAAVVPGTIIQMQDEADLNAYYQYEVIATTDSGTHYVFDVVLLDTGASGAPTIGLRQQAYFEVPIAAPTDYVVLTNHFLNEPDIAGYLSFDDVVGGADTDDGYGIDVFLQEFTASPDWDIAAVSGGSGSGGGGGEFLPLAGGDMTGEIKMGQNILWDLPNPANPTDAARKGYVDAPSAAITDQPGGRVLAAAAGGVIQRWNGDGDGVARKYEWRRSAAFGTLELYAITSADVATLAISISDTGLVTIPNLAP